MVFSALFYPLRCVTQRQGTPQRLEKRRDEVWDGILCAFLLSAVCNSGEGTPQRLEKRRDEV
jgi:hypothetical protein